MGSRRRAFALTGLACALVLLAATSCASSKAKVTGTPVPPAYSVGGVWYGPAHLTVHNAPLTLVLLVTMMQSSGGIVTGSYQSCRGGQYYTTETVNGQTSGKNVTFTLKLLPASAYTFSGSLASGALSMRDSAGDTMTLRQGSAADYHSACAAQSTATPGA
ncbi:MAG: hypothetical protein ACRDHE_04510 [Ktedonobacterales bacterium]